MTFNQHNKTVKMIRRLVDLCVTLGKSQQKDVEQGVPMSKETEMISEIANLLKSQLHEHLLKSRD